MPIDHNKPTNDGLIKAEPIRLHEKGHGLTGVIFSADERPQTDWRSGEPLKWDDGNPIEEYILNFAAKAGKANFAKRDADGKPLKGSDGRTILEERTFNETDVCVIASGKGSYDLYKKCKELKVNEGFEVRIERLTGSGNTKVDYEVVVISTDNPLRRFDPDAPAPSGIDHGTSSGATEPDRELVESPF